MSNFLLFLIAFLSAKRAIGWFIFIVVVAVMIGVVRH